MNDSKLDDLFKNIDYMKLEKQIKHFSSLNSIDQEIYLKSLPFSNAMQLMTSVICMRLTLRKIINEVKND